MNRKIKTRPDASLPTNKENPLPKYIPMNYMDQISHKVGRVFKKAGYTPAYRLNKNLIPGNHKINNNNENPKTFSDKGVYKITCPSPCNKQYIGYTNRNFHQRFKEHNTPHYKNPISVIAKHLKENQSHQITFPDSIEILHKTKSRPKAKILESYQIYKHVNSTYSALLLSKKEDCNNSLIFETILKIENLEKATQSDNTATNRQREQENRGPLEIPRLHVGNPHPLPHNSHYDATQPYV
jgi:hypothetical protein